MVKFIPFEQNDPDEIEKKSSIVQQVETMRAVKSMLTCYGDNLLPPEKIDFDDDELMEQIGFVRAVQ